MPTGKGVLDDWLQLSRRPTFGRIGPKAHEKVAGDAMHQPQWRHAIEPWLHFRRQSAQQRRMARRQLLARPPQRGVALPIRVPRLHTWGIELKHGVVMVAKEHGPAVFEQSVQDPIRPGAAVDHVAQHEDRIGRTGTDILHHRFQRGQVAVNIRKQSDSYHAGCQDMAKTRDEGRGANESACANRYCSHCNVGAQSLKKARMR